MRCSSFPIFDVMLRVLSFASFPLAPSLSLINLSAQISFTLNHAIPSSVLFGLTVALYIPFFFSFVLPASFIYLFIFFFSSDGILSSHASQLTISSPQGFLIMSA